MRVTITLDNGATFGTGSTTSNVVTTTAHIPGSALRGAFAAAWIAQHGAPDADFDELFEGPVRFGPLFAIGEPLSLAVLKHKRDSAPICARRWWDLAVEDAPSDGRCPDCDSPLEASKGKLEKPPRLHSETHVQLLPEKESRQEKRVASEGDLFTRRVIREQGLEFHGYIDLPESLGSQPRKQFLELTRLRLGGRRSTSGGATVTWGEETVEPLTQRIDGGLILRLASPGIFVDALGRPRPEPRQTELSELLNTDVRIVKSWTRWTTVSGWHIASGLPKPVDIAVEAGSTYRLATADAVQPDRLLALEHRGIGLRRHEGFGALAGPPHQNASISAFQQRYPKDYPRVIQNYRNLAERRRSDPHASPGQTTEKLLLSALSAPALSDYHQALQALVNVKNPDLLMNYLDYLEAGR